MFRPSYSAFHGDHHLNSNHKIKTDHFYTMASSILSFVSTAVKAEAEVKRKMLIIRRVSNHNRAPPASSAQYVTREDRPFPFELFDAGT